MCGIAGLLNRNFEQPADPALLRSMGDTISHRGPDAEGIWTDGGLGLVHRRLSIIDLAGGDQPIGNEDGSIQVVFNGEIYNFEKLRSELANKGHRFKTRSDTEILVHLYEEVGPRLVEQLRGMFTFALWDRNNRTLMLARDRMGIKPLYFFRDGDRIIFGSELKPLLVHPEVRREIDVESLEDYLAFGMVSGKRSIFRGIEKLPPAHVLVIGPNDWNSPPRRYWELQIQPNHSLSVQAWQEAVRAKLDETVRAHLIADVPVGAFLSGGVDSSVVVSIASRHMAGPLQTFSIGFNEETFSELPYARMVSQQYRTQHVERILTPDAVNLVDELTTYFDEPFADSSAIPTYLVSRLASQSVKVVLSGDGGDEAFGGYARYAHDLMEASLRNAMPAWLRKSVIAGLARVWPKADWLPRPLRAKTLLTNLSKDAAGAYANTLTLCRMPLRRRIISSTFGKKLNGHNPERAILECFAKAPADDPLAGMISADVGTLLPDDFLVKVDRASMAHGLEVRPPLLDHELLELTARIPSQWKVHNGQTKWLLKEVYRQELPSSVMDRPKRGFEIPVDAWLRGPLRDMFESTVLQSQSKVSELIDREAASKLYRAHLSGMGRHGGVLWSLLMLARWSDRYLHCPTQHASAASAISLHS
jgi:asparagine synthase (glutamine-hydrolysing)